MGNQSTFFEQARVCVISLKFRGLLSRAKIKNMLAYPGVDCSNLFSFSASKLGPLGAFLFWTMQWECKLTLSIAEFFSFIFVNNMQEIYLLICSDGKQPC